MIFDISAARRDAAKCTQMRSVELASHIGAACDEIERLTRERDEARKEMLEWRVRAEKAEAVAERRKELLGQTLPYVPRFIKDDIVDEIAPAKLKPEHMRDSASLPDIDDLRAAKIRDLREQLTATQETLRTANAQLAAANERAEKAQRRIDNPVTGFRAVCEWWRVRAKKAEAFKSYVHARLDRAGVPVEPQPPKHALEGCRVGDRLDWIIERAEKMEAVSERRKYLLERALYYVAKHVSKYGDAWALRNDIADELAPAKLKPEYMRKYAQPDGPTEMGAPEDVRGYVGPLAARFVPPNDITDDCTVDFAQQLVEKDARIAELETQVAYEQERNMDNIMGLDMQISNMKAMLREARPFIGHRRISGARCAGVCSICAVCDHIDALLKEDAPRCAIFDTEHYAEDAQIAERDARITELEAALLKIRTMERDDTSPETYYFTSQAIVRDALLKEEEG